MNPAKSFLRSTSAIFVFVLWASNAFASVDLWVWQPTPTSVRLILPRVDQESAQASYDRYMQSIRTDHDLQSVLHSINPPQGSMHAFGEISHSGLLTFTIANRAQDMSAEPNRMNGLVRPFAKHGADLFTIPVAAESGLDPEQADQFRKKVATMADLVIGVGGEDIDPRLDGKDNSAGLSRNVHPSRDFPEARLWKEILTSGHAYVVGICRSHQMILSLLGYDLVQDLESVLGTASHRTGHHALVSEADSPFSPLFRILPNGESNTIHHQGFSVIGANGQVLLIATDGKGIVEATVFKNGRGVTFQFHPELMDAKVVEEFVRIVMEQASEAKLNPPAPSKVRDFEHARNNCYELLAH